MLAVIISLILMFNGVGVMAQAQLVSVLTLPQDLQQALRSVTRFTQAPFREPTLALDRATTTFKDTMNSVSQQFAATASDTSGKMSQNVDKSLVAGRQMMSTAARIAQTTMEQMQTIAPSVGTDAATTILASNELRLIIIAIIILGTGVWMNAIVILVKCLIDSRRCTIKRSHKLDHLSADGQSAKGPSFLEQNDIVAAQPLFPAAIKDEAITIKEPPPSIVAPSVAASSASAAGAAADADVELVEVSIVGH